MKKTILLYALLCFISCSSRQKQYILIENLSSIGVKRININNNYSISFRDSTGKIDWEWFNDDSIVMLPDSFITTYLNNIPELQKWADYQKCSIDGYHTLNDSSQLLIITNRVLNENEANKYLVKINNNIGIEKVFLLAKVEKSIDDLFEIYSVISDNKILQTQIHKILEGDSLITLKKMVEFSTKNFAQFETLKIDSIRTIEH